MAGVTGCGSSSPAGDAKAASSAPATTSPAAATPTSTVISEQPYQSPTFTTPPPPSTPEEKIDALADQHDWQYDSTDYDDAAAFVQDVCDTLTTDSADPDAISSPAQGLSENNYDAGEKKLIAAGAPLLCPEWAKAVKAAFSGTYPVWISDGTFKVTSHRADDAVPPGTYRTTGDLSGCYWERTRANGDIIDNNYATAATRITVTIRSSDDLFTSTDCGTWKPVG